MAYMCPKCGIGGLLKEDFNEPCERHEFLSKNRAEIAASLEQQKIEEQRKLKEEFENKITGLLITTTASVDGRKAIEYKGIVTAQVFMGISLFKDIFSGIRDIVGGRSKAIESEFNKAKELLLRELRIEAVNIGANAVVGLKIDFEDVGKVSGNAFMLLGTGTAVVIE